MKKGDIFKSEVTAKVAECYDVLVCGGGTAGVAAAIAAARNGAKTALIEGSPFLGGMMTEGNAGLTKFVIHGKDPDEQTKITKELRDNPKSVQFTGGIPMEIVTRLIERGAALGTSGTAGSYVYTDRQEFKILLFEMLKEAGADIFLHSPICDVIKEENCVLGVVTQTKSGRLAYMGRYIVDATGDGDVAALAGVPYVVGVGPDDEVYKQGISDLGMMVDMGVMFRIGGVNFDEYVEYLRQNPEMYMVQSFGLMSFDEFLKAYEAGEMVIFRGVMPTGRTFQVYNYPHPGIMVGLAGPVPPDGRSGLKINDLTETEYVNMVKARELVRELRDMVPGFEDAFVLDTPRVGVRETRHIEGEYKLNRTDVYTMRDFEDTVGKSCHPIDIYPPPRDPEVRELPDRTHFNIPYRCLVAKGVDNVLLAGRCISATHEAFGSIRPTVPCMITGESAGTAASILCKCAVSKAKDIDIEKLRNTLKNNGVIL